MNSDSTTPQKSYREYTTPGLITNIILFAKLQHDEEFGSEKDNRCRDEIALIGKELERRATIYEAIRDSGLLS